MTYSFSKPLTLAAVMALGLAGCNNSSQTSTDAPADDATTTETTTNGTLQKIKDSGTIVVGHRDSSIPFSGGVLKSMLAIEVNKKSMLSSLIL